MRKEIINTDKAARMGLPLSQAVRAGNLVFTFGSVPMDPETGQVFTGDIKEQTRIAIENLKAILEAAGTSLSSVVKCTVYLTDFKDFEPMTEVYKRYFGPEYPARTTVQVVGLYKGVRVEIEAVALVP